jgi:hypothetical protein
VVLPLVLDGLLDKLRQQAFLPSDFPLLPEAHGPKHQHDGEQHDTQQTGIHIGKGSKKKACLARQKQVSDKLESVFRQTWKSDRQT